MDVLIRADFKLIVHHSILRPAVGCVPWSELVPALDALLYDMSMYICFLALFLTDMPACYPYLCMLNGACFSVIATVSSRFQSV